MTEGVTLRDAYNASVSAALSPELGMIRCFHLQIDCGVGASSHRLGRVVEWLEAYTHFDTHCASASCTRRKVQPIQRLRSSKAATARAKCVQMCETCHRLTASGFLGIQKIGLHERVN